MIRQLPVIPTILVVAAAGVMVWLGFWQLARAEEKAELIARYEEALADDGLIPVQAHQARAVYRRISDDCIDPQLKSPVSGRNAVGRNGWVHVVRCTMGGPPAIASPEEEGVKYVPYPVDVVLGWSISPEPVDWDGGTVTGIVVPFGELGYKIIADPPLAGLQANAKPDPNDLPNNHLAYAGQWFFFALTALVVYWFAVQSRLKRRK